MARRAGLAIAVAVVMAALLLVCFLVPTEAVFRLSSRGTVVESTRAVLPVDAQAFAAPPPPPPPHPLPDPPPPPRPQPPARLHERSPAVSACNASECSVSELVARYAVDDTVIVTFGNAKQARTPLPATTRPRPALRPDASIALHSYASPRTGSTTSTSSASAASSSASWPWDLPTRSTHLSPRRCARAAWACTASTRRRWRVTRRAADGSTCCLSSLLASAWCAHAPNDARAPGICSNVHSSHHLPAKQLAT